LGWLRPSEVVVPGQEPVLGAKSRELCLGRSAVAPSLLLSSHRGERAQRVEITLPLCPQQSGRHAELLRREGAVASETARAAQPGVRGFEGFAGEPAVGFDAPLEGADAPSERVVLSENASVVIGEAHWSRDHRTPSGHITPGSHLPTPGAGGGARNGCPRGT